MIAADVSEETLHNFRCTSCGCWWSMADFDLQRASWPAPYIHCPRCGRALAFPAIAETRHQEPAPASVDWSAA